jgi:hypothetical protein
MNLPLISIAPPDFDEVFVKIGRVACEDHYEAGRSVIDSWLRQRGKKRLIEARAVHVREHHAKRINREDMGCILSRAYPIEQEPEVDPLVAEQAAQFMRMVRNGGWPVSRHPDGLWTVGTSRKTPAELIAIATRKGFTPNLTAPANTKIG